MGQRDGAGVSTLSAVRLAPDRALPHRDALLDDTLVGQRLDALLTAAGAPGAGSCTRVRAKYRVGESLRVTLRLAGAPARLVSARMFPPGQAAGHHARALAAEGVLSSEVLLDEGLDTVFWVFPRDRKLTGLEALTDPPADLRHAFRSASAGGPWATGLLMAYSPEKAATARCLDADGTVLGYAKVQSGEDGIRSLATLTAAGRGLRRGGALRLAEAVGFSPEHRMAFTSPAPGRPLHELERDAVPSATAALGAALAVLHRQPTQGFAPSVRLDAGRVVRAGQLVGAARPDLDPLLRRVVPALAAAAPAAGPPVLLHGDLHPKNVLVHDAGVSLVDLDQAGTGPAAAELGAMLARLWWPRPGDDIAPATADAAAHALLSSYDGPLDRSTLGWYAAASLVVERALRAVSRVDVDALAGLETVLTTALRWADHPPEGRP